MSEPVYYFSNGTEGRIWQDQWCNRCTHDHVTHNPEPDYENGCRHILSMVAGIEDDAFIRINNGRYDELHCLNFARCSCDNGPEDPPGPPPPMPPNPNQGVLFDVEQVAPGVWRDVVLDELKPAEVLA